MMPKMKPDRIDYAIGAFGLTTVALTVLGVAWLDPYVAAQTTEQAGSFAALGKFVGLLDFLTGKDISTFLLGFVMIATALAMLGLGKFSWLGRPLLYVGLVQFSITVIADLSKPQLGRLRPFETTNSGPAADLWFVAGNSFPSGHVASYAGLGIPLIVLFPRWWPLFIAIPASVAFERIASNDHYFSDVTASFALSALAALVWRFILSNRPAPAPH